jgi:hypothetical protein
MIEHICENCKHQELEHDKDNQEWLTCEYGYNTYIACQCAYVNDSFEPVEVNKTERINN